MRGRETSSFKSLIEYAKKTQQYDDIINVIKAQRNEQHSLLRDPTVMRALGDLDNARIMRSIVKLDPKEYTLWLESDFSFIKKEYLD